MPRKNDFKKEINWDLVKLYVKSGATQRKICEAFHIDECTLRARVKKEFDQEWSAFSAALISEGHMLLEAAMFQKALKSSSPGNTQMLIWLSKVKLGYREPELNNLKSPNEDSIIKDQRIMELEHKLAQLEEANDNKSKTKSELL